MTIMDIINDFAGKILLTVILWFAAEQALIEWREWAINRATKAFNMDGTPP